MLQRFAKLFLALALLLSLGALSLLRRPAATGGAVRILRFYATTGSLTTGQSAQLCYAVENARLVRISPMQTSSAAQSRCLDVVPEHTTHYTLLAEGFDGMVATRSFTLAVLPLRGPAEPTLQFAQFPSRSRGKAPLLSR
jgi:hypothetical protein